VLSKVIKPICVLGNPCSLSRDALIVSAATCTHQSSHTPSHPGCFYPSFAHAIHIQGNREPLSQCTTTSKTLLRPQTISQEQQSWSIPHVTAIFTFTIPDFTADNETSIRKKYTGGIGGRTIYSVGATNSTLPLESSGLSSASRRRPFSSKGLKYSTGTEREHMVHSRRSTCNQTVHIRQDLSTPTALSTRQT
jgi:hypothetical protein